MKTRNYYYTLIAVILICLAGVTYLFYSKEESQDYSSINSFEKCAEIYPVMESFPERCATPDGRSFTKEYPRVSDSNQNNQSNKPSVPSKPDNGSTTTEPIFCTMEAKQCPDGSYVGRSGPKCEFAPCPGN
jgi:hypothetical protein